MRVSGVKVGKIDSIEPEGTQTKMTLKVDRDVPIPADAKAVIVAQNLVAARYVQLTPAYRKGGGPTMRDGAVIPSDRTAVPVEWDEVKTQLMRLATELGPKTGVSGTSVSRFIDSAANALDGNGDKLRQTLAQLSGAARIFAEGSGNIVDIIKNLQIFVTALARQQAADRHVPEPAGQSDQRGERQQVRSGRGVVRSVGRDRRGAALRRRQSQPERPSRFSEPGRRHPDPGRQPHRRSRTSCTSRRTRSPTTRTSTTRNPADR